MEHGYGAMLHRRRISPNPLLAKWQGYCMRVRAMTVETECAIAMVRPRHRVVTPKGAIDAGTGVVLRGVHARARAGAHAVLRCWSVRLRHGQVGMRVRQQLVVCVGSRLQGARRPRVRVKQEPRVHRPQSWGNTVSDFMRRIHVQGDSLQPRSRTCTHSRARQLVFRKGCSMVQ